MSNWEFFRQQWRDKQDSKIRLASFCSVMGKKNCLTFLKLNISAEERNNVQACMTALEN